MFIFHLNQSLEEEELNPAKVLVLRRWIGWSLRLISLSMAVLGCQSGNQGYENGSLTS